MFSIIVHFNIQKLKNKQTFIQTENAKSSHFDRTRGDKNQIYPTLNLVHLSPGLQFVVNMTPYVSLPFNAAHLSYTLGISTKVNLIDQKRNLIDVLPGFKTVVKVIPSLSTQQHLLTEWPFQQETFWGFKWV